MSNGEALQTRQLFRKMNEWITLLIYQLEKGIFTSTFVQAVI